MTDEAHKGNVFMQPFLILSKSLQGDALSKLIYQVTELQGIYKFGELLQQPNVQALSSNNNFKKDWNLLNLFAFGTYTDYSSDILRFPELNENHKLKLRLLTIATLASKFKFVTYKNLRLALELDNIRVIEDLIIEAIYANIIQGKLNQKDQRLEVDFVIGRDIEPEKIDYIVSILESWCDGCDKAVGSLEKLVLHANLMKEGKSQQKKVTESEIEDVKNVLKAQDSSTEVQSSSQKSKGSMKTMLKSSSRIK